MRWNNLIAATLLSSLTLSLTPYSNHYRLSSEQQAIAEMNNLYVIGDSLSDAGGIVGAGTQFFKGNWILPNIQSIKMEEPYHNNQFCNGPNPVSVIAQYFHKPLTPAWKFQKIPFVGKTYEQVGENYAIGAARLGWSIYSGAFFVNLFSAQAQVESLLAQHRNISDHDWVMFVMGANDLLAVMQDATFPLPWEIYLDLAIYKEKEALLTLINNHVSNIVVTDVPDISKTPAFSHDPTLKLKAETTFNYFHQKWAAMIETLSKQYPQQIDAFDLSTVVNETLIELGKKGLNITDGASEIDFYDSFLKDGVLHPKLNPGVTLDTVNNYFFVDSVHPTAAASKVIGLKLAHFITNKIKKNYDLK